MQVLNGFVKIHRKLLQWGWYQDHAVKEVWLHLILNAAFKQGTYKGRIIYPGQVVIGRQSLAKELDFSEQEIRTALNKLKSTNEITIETTNKFSVATLVNWNEYQSNDEEATNEITNTPTNEQPTINQPSTNHQPHLKNKRIKEYMKERKKATSSYDEIINSIENLALRGTLVEFIKMRKLIKSPMTDKALTLLISKLNKLSGGDVHTQIAMLNESIENNWKSVYPLKEAPKSKPSIYDSGQYDYEEIRRKSRENIRKKLQTENPQQEV